MATHATTTDQLALGAEDHGRIVSAEEFAAAEFAESWIYERVAGRLSVMAPDGQEHNDSGEPWRDRLVDYKLNARPGVIRTVKSEAWIRVDDGTDRVADIAVYLATDRPMPKLPDRVPDLVFEVVSPGKEARDRDYVEKRADYHNFGVPGYVIVDRFESRVTVLVHAPGGYIERILKIGDIYTTPLLPGFAVALAEVLAP